MAKGHWVALALLRRLLFHYGPGPSRPRRTTSLAKTAPSMRQPKEHYFRALKYKIQWRRPRGYPGYVAGTCDPPDKKGRTIEIDPNLAGFDLLRVLIDESIHGCLFDLDNESVCEMSTSIASFLWECGYRRVDT